MTQPLPTAPTKPQQLLNRSCVVTVGTTQVSNIGQQLGLHTWFSVRRSLKAGEPNTADLRIWGLSDATRKAIDAAASTIVPGVAGKFVPVKIEAGYVGATATIFLGQMRSSQTTIDGPETVTELQTGDGDDAMILARSSAAISAGANALAVAKRLLSDARLSPGNLASVQAVLQAAALYRAGVVLKGSSWDLLVDLARGCGLEVSIQNGSAQWTSLGQPLAGQAYSLSSDTGLIGSPTVDTKGVLSFEMLMAPGIAPGVPVVMNAKYVQGLYRVTAVETVGDVAGVEWVHRCEAKRFGLAA